MESPQVVEVIDQTYQKNVHWRSNIFKIPSGKQGKAFVKEMAHLFTCYAEGSSMGRIALKMAMIFPSIGIAETILNIKKQGSHQMLGKNVTEVI